MTPVVALAATASRDGYWLVTAGGTVHAFGSAKAMGDAAELPTYQPVVAIAGASARS